MLRVIIAALMLYASCVGPVRADFPSTHMGPGTIIDGGQFNGGGADSNFAIPGIQRNSLTLTVCPTMTVDCQFTSVVAAYNSINGILAINPFAPITIHVNDGTYTETGNVFATTPQTANVQLIGNTDSPGNVVLNFTNIARHNGSGFIAINGGKIGLIDGFTINGVGARLTSTPTGATWQDQSYGAAIFAAFGGLINIGPHVLINNFYYGVEADNGGLINAASGGVTVSGAGDVDFMARGAGSVIVCNNCHALGASDITHTDQAILGSGFDAERGGTLYIDGSDSINTRTACVNALTNGAAWAHGVSCGGGLSGLGFGFWALEGGSIETTGSTVTGYVTGVVAAGGGFIDVSGTAVTSSSGDGIAADMGHITGSGAFSYSNGGYGVHALHGGIMELFGTLANLTGNTTGAGASDPAGTMSGASWATYGASSIYIN